MTRSGHCNPGFKEVPQAASVPSRVWRHERGERAPHTMVRHGDGGISGAPRRIGGTLEGGFAPVLSYLVRPEGGMRAHGCRGFYQPCRTTIVRSTSCLSACIDKVAV